VPIATSTAVPLWHEEISSSVATPSLKGQRRVRGKFMRSRTGEEHERFGEERGIGERVEAID
jgi:hypothetical protein